MDDNQNINLVENDIELELEMQEDNPSIIDRMKKIFGITSNENVAMTAKNAWLQSMYGTGYTPCVKDRIKTKQAHIAEAIKSKFRYTQTDCTKRTNVDNYSTYHCVVDIEEDLKKYTSLIFKPFEEAGFKIINLSDKIEELKDDEVYLISWKNAYKE